MIRFCLNPKFAEYSVEELAKCYKLRYESTSEATIDETVAKKLLTKFLNKQRIDVRVVSTAVNEIDEFKKLDLPFISTKIKPDISVFQEIR